MPAPKHSAWSSRAGRQLRLVGGAQVSSVASGLLIYVPQGRGRSQEAVDVSVGACVPHSGAPAYLS